MKKHTTKYLIGLLSVLILASTVATSCTKASENTDSDVVFTDALGRQVGVDKNPARVAALLGSFADVWVLSGGELCAAPNDAEEDFGIDLAGIVNVGGAHSPSLELLLSSSPDLVLASASTASHVSLLDTLTAAGITVAYFDVDSFDDYLNMLSICTEITGREDLFVTHGLNVKARIDAVKEKYTLAISNGEADRILMLRAASSFIKAKGSTGTILGEMLADLGCINIADSDTSLLEDLSVEAVIKNQPYRIFAVTMGNDEEAARACLYNTLNENAAWASLEAVREGRIYVMDKTLFNLKPNERWAEAYEVLYEKLTEN